MPDHHDLATSIKGLTKNVNTIATSLEDFARMVKTGFDEMAGTMKAGFEVVENRLTTLENGQEEIKLRLTNVAYRFELVELENQVKTLTKEMKTLKQLVMSKIKPQGNEA